MRQKCATIVYGTCLEGMSCIGPAAGIKTVRMVVVWLYAIPGRRPVGILLF